MRPDIVAKQLCSRAVICLGVGTDYCNVALGTGIPKICDTSGEEFCSEEHAQAGLAVAEGSSWCNSQKGVQGVCDGVGMGYTGV